MAMADEAERLANIVSYTRDKVRLHEQAKSWREQAQTATVASIETTFHETGARHGLSWFRRRSA